MRTILMTFLILGVSCLCYAQDFSKINEENIKTFIKIMPEYQTLVAKHEEDMKYAQGKQDTSDFIGNVKKLMEQYGITMHQFAIFFKRVNIGFIALRMGKHGSDQGLKKAIEAIEGPGDKVNITDEELEVLKKHEQDIMSVLQRQKY